MWLPGRGVMLAYPALLVAEFVEPTYHFEIPLVAILGNLPKDECEYGWRLLQSFALGVQEPIPASVNPENVITGIEVRGFYIWHNMSVAITRKRR
jgi:hypothetical protein